MRFALPIVLFVPGYWFCISGRGFGGLLALFASPLVLAAALALSARLRSRLGVESKLHAIDFVGVIGVLAASWFLIPTIR
jgi:hypothetical protein